MYQDSSFKIPAIYLNDWPDRYIHTNFDTAANIDPTKLKRAAFIGAASGYFLANLNDGMLSNLIQVMDTNRTTRLASDLRRNQQLSDDEQSRLMRHSLRYEQEVAASTDRFVPRSVPTGEVKFKSTFGLRELASNLAAEPKPSGDGVLIFSRKQQPKGPVAVFGSDYVNDRSGAAGVAPPRILSYEGLWGSGEEYAYEVLNFADGRRNAQQIRDAVAAEYGPVPLELVVEYLRVLEKVGLVEQVK